MPPSKSGSLGCSAFLEWLEPGRITPLDRMPCRGKLGIRGRIQPDRFTAAAARPHDAQDHGLRSAEIEARLYDGIERRQPLFERDPVACRPGPGAPIPRRTGIADGSAPRSQTARRRIPAPSQWRSRGSAGRKGCRQAPTHDRPSCAPPWRAAGCRFPRARERARGAFLRVFRCWSDRPSIPPGSDVSKLCARPSRASSPVSDANSLPGAGAPAYEQCAPEQ